MSRRKRIPSGVSVPGHAVTLFELRRPAPDKVQVRWQLDGIGASSRTYPDTRSGRKEAAATRAELAKLIAGGAPFDTGTREPVSWSASLMDAAAVDAAGARRSGSLLEFARRFISLRWPDLEARSRGDLMDVLMALAELPQGCSSKFPTLCGGQGSGWELLVTSVSSRSLMATGSSQWGHGPPRPMRVQGRLQSVHHWVP